MDPRERIDCAFQERWSSWLPMSQRTGKPGFSTGIIASASWYAKLAELCGDSFTTSTMIGLADELVQRLSVDSMLILRYPKGAAPQLLYGRTEHLHRANKIDDYLLGHYVLDPFYGRAEYCSNRGLTSLREVIEEDFASSEYYKTHYQAAGLIDEMCFCCSDGAGGHLNLSLSRTLGRSHFTAAELEAARAIAPLVTAALRTTWRALSPEGGCVSAELRGDHHLHIENARRNFGRSVLTEREFEILQHLLYGKSIDFIARRLEIAASTVKVHRKHIYSKLNINSQAEIFTLLLEVVGATQYEPGRDPLAAYQPPPG
jgi:DNA-binding CsgD family transcriptional regulator